MLVSRNLDTIVYGATGFTGRLVAEYLAQRYRDDGSLRWALAGRNRDKLEEVRALIGVSAEMPLVVADSNDPASLRSMAESTRIVISTVGPYQLYGSALVEACVTTGTSYVDLCGEPAWIREMIDRHEAQARASGARIVFSCGFDSIPFDCGVQQLQKCCIHRFGRPAPRIKGRVRAVRGGFSGGTVASLKATLAAAARRPALFRQLADPFALSPGFEGPAQPSTMLPYWDAVVEAWVQRGAGIKGAAALTPAPTCSGDADVVRASQVQHAVEHVDSDVHLGRPTLIRMRAQPVADHLFPSANRGLGPGPFRVPGGCLPGHPALLGNKLEVAVPLGRCTLSRVARHRG
jgi:Saccharopine dehydrogenase NADP binding domain